MKLNVPFYLQTTSLNCGPAALRMVISYFDKDLGIALLEKRTGIQEGKAVLTSQIAIAAARSGYDVEFFSKHISFNEENLKLDFYKKYSDAAMRSGKTIEEARKLGVQIGEKVLSLSELLQKINERSIPIVLLDWNVIKGVNGYQGHFVPVVGYNDESIYVHNHGLNNPQAFFPIKKEVFEKSRKAQGTDEDILVIKKKI
ncbi:MAG: hypothetical protein RL557_903 [archaeon]|jgi:ABC-type bacteriocin/lantibiotic exporter with double-glycine peptidase domain